MSSFVTAASSFDLQLLGETNRDSSRLGSNYIPTTPADASLLPPFSTHSYSASPSNFGTPGDLNSPDNGVYSEYSEYTGDDEFYGVDFDVNEQGIDDPSLLLVDIPLPTTELPAVEAYLPQPHTTQPSGNRANPTYPLSPKHTNSPNSQSPNIDQEVEARMRSSGYDTSMDMNVSGAYPLSITNLQPTPDRSGSSHASAEEVLPSTMRHMVHSPQVTLTTSEGKDGPTVLENQEWYITPNRKLFSQSQDASEVIDYANAERNQLPARDSDEAPERTGLDPEQRKPLADVEIRNFKDQAEQERLTLGNQRVDEWVSFSATAIESVSKASGGESHLASGLPVGGQRGRAKTVGTAPDFHRVEYEPAYFIKNVFDSETTRDVEEVADIDPVSDSESIRANQIKDGQIYYNSKGGEITDADLHLMQESRHWNDAPVLPHRTNTPTQPPTAADAMMKFNELSDNLSMFSRSATWGTRRRSEPSLTDIESIKDGNFLKRLSLGKGKERLSGRFRGSIDQIANIMKRHNSNKLKRSGSNREGRSRQDLDSNQTEHLATLAPPSRSTSCGKGKPRSPRVNTSLSPSGPGPMDRGRSLSATSPIQSLTDMIGVVTRRARSKSDLPSGIAGLWSQAGGPPVASLGSHSFDGEALKQPDPSDVEGEDEEDEDPADDGEKMVFDEVIPIVPTSPGFQEHVLRLNPTMEQSNNYLVERIAHQQLVRYKTLLGWRIKHANAIVNKSCTSDSHCISLGGSVTLYDAKGALKLSNSGLQNATDGSDGDSNPEGALAAESFPLGVPIPPTQTLPAEFECQLCFRVKKFMKPSDWTKHVHEDVQPFTCTYPNCREPKSFKRKADWVRHENERHRHLEWWTCQVDDCTHKCFRKDNFLQHLVREHKHQEPKQKTKAAVKKAHGSDERVWQMVRNCHHETTAKPQDEPCKFCGKILTSWKKLTVHLAKHMEHISLPVLRIVEQQQVDANTVISPVDAPPTRPAPLTPIDQSNSPNHFRISPNVRSMAQFQTTVYPPHTSPNVQSMGPFQNEPLGQPLYSGTDLPFGIQAPIPQQPTMFESNPGVSYGFRHMGNQLNTHQPQGYTSLDHSPSIDQSHGFQTASQNFNSSIAQSGYPYSNPNSSLSPDPASFVSGAPSFPQTLGSDPGGLMPGSHEVASFEPRNVLGISSNSYNYQRANGPEDTGGMGYNQISLSRSQGNLASYSAQSSQGHGGDYSQMTMPGGSGRPTYPPTSNASYGYHG